MDKLVQLVGFLNDPHLVASVQNTFGIRMIGVVTQNQDENEHEKKYNGNCMQNHNEDKYYQQKNQIKHVKLLDNKKCLYKVDSKFFYWFFLFITQMGNEIFYILFLPMLSWNYDYKFMYLTAVSWSIVMYIGQAMKDIIELPRPMTPPAIKLEEKYFLGKVLYFLFSIFCTKDEIYVLNLKEYGFPSTHCIAAVNIAFCICHFLFERYNKSEDANFRIYSLIIAIIVCFLVSLSRIYLGMHSFLDVFGGITFSLAFSLIYVKYAHNLDIFLKQSIFSGVIAFAFFVLICIFYPSKKRWSPARADTFLISGVGCGLCLGMALKYSLGLDNFGVIKNFNQNFISLTSLIILRSIIGVIIIVSARYLSKDIVYFGVKQYFKLKSNSTRNEIRDKIKQNFLLEIFYYIFCYSIVSFNVIFTSFLAFQYLNLV
jgi:sphingosine-1-phosphate phosphatase 1